MSDADCIVARVLHDPYVRAARKHPGLLELIRAMEAYGNLRLAFDEEREDGIVYWVKDGVLYRGRLLDEPV
jgi:hypothetical protein